MTLDQKSAYLKRLNRIAGQARGVVRMLDEDRDCLALLNQLQALSGGLSALENLLLGDSLVERIEQELDGPSGASRRAVLDELMIEVRRKWSERQSALFGGASTGQVSGDSCFPTPGPSGRSQPAPRQVTLEAFPTFQLLR